MAISIKNHEDRITALEKRCKISCQEYFYIKQSPYVLDLNKYNGDIFFLTMSMYIYAPYGSSTTPDTKSNRCFTCIATKQTNHSSVFSDLIIYDMGSNHGLNASPSLVVDKGVIRLSNASKTTNYLQYLSWLGYIIGLKLYYNFSYNITREFYKVKFKLKHYLCSHLQKFI